MHIYFSGIGGAGIGPLAQVAFQAGYTVSGSDKQDSSYISYLKKQGISNIHIGQSKEAISLVHKENPIDWFVYTSALPLENPFAPELIFCKENNIKATKRDKLVNQILEEKNLKLVAIAGTHGKTTTTAMVTWLFKQIGSPISYLLPAKTSFAEMGHFDPDSSYFIFEADEFDRNFLAFEPSLSLISGVSWDHHEIFKTRNEYKSAFMDFINQSGKTFVWQEDAEYLGLSSMSSESVCILDSSDKYISTIKIRGKYNRLDAWLAIQAVHQITDEPIDNLIKVINGFPGLSRRMELITPGLYSDYAHTPEKIRGVMSVAKEMAAETNQNLVVVYEPLTNRRQHYILEEYRDCFEGANKIYWVPSYLAREDSSQAVLSPQQLISHLDDPSIAVAAELNDALKEKLREHLKNGDLVVGMAGGGGNSLDDWLRQEFK